MRKAEKTASSFFVGYASKITVPNKSNAKQILSLVRGKRTNDLPRNITQLKVRYSPNDKELFE